MDRKPSACLIRKVLAQALLETRILYNFAGWADRFDSQEEEKSKSPPVNATRAKNIQKNPVKILRSMELARRRQLHSFALN